MNNKQSEKEPLFKLIYFIITAIIGLVMAGIVFAVEALGSSLVSTMVVFSDALGISGMLLIVAGIMYIGLKAMGFYGLSYLVMRIGRLFNKSKAVVLTYSEYKKDARMEETRVPVHLFIIGIAFVVIALIILAAGGAFN